MLTGADVGDRPFRRSRPSTRASSVGRLAVDKVRYVGDPVAPVVAESRTAAVDAAELVDVDYDPLPAVIDMEAALEPGAPAVRGAREQHRRVAQGRRPVRPWGDAAHVVRVRMANQRVATAPMEGHTIVVQPDDDGLTVLLTTQQPHGARDQLATFTGLPPERVRVVTPHVGGAFWRQGRERSPEHGAMVAAARRLGRPVAWTETRSETMLSMHSRGQVQYAEMGLTAPADPPACGCAWSVTDAYGGFGGSFVLGGTSTDVPGCLRGPAIRYAAIAALTNTTPMVLPAALAAEAAALVERLIDVAADELGLAPEEIRRRNLWSRRTPFVPHPHGCAVRRRRLRPPLRERRCGSPTSTACAEQHRRRGGRAAAAGHRAVDVRGDHRLRRHWSSARSRSTRTARRPSWPWHLAHGQGHATAFAMIVSDRLGIPMDQILRPVRHRPGPQRGGTGGSGRSSSAAARWAVPPTRSSSGHARSRPSCSRRRRPTSPRSSTGGLGGVRRATVTWAEVPGEPAG